MLNIDSYPAFEQKIISSLANSVNPNNEERKMAEQSLKEAQKTPGYASALLKISADLSLKGQFQIDINHAASIQFGQLVEVHWKFRDAEHAAKVATSGFDYILINEQDKQCVRENIMNAILNMVQNKLIQKQFIRSLKMICVHDFPDKLPNLFGQCMEYLKTQNQLTVYAGLQGLFALAARYEFEMDEDRLPLHQIIQESFTVLGGLVNDMINNKENTDALYMLHLVCKVFYVGNQLQMCPYLMEGDNLDPWIMFFKTILDMECPADLCSATDDQDEIQRRDKSIFWKIKGITAKITYRIFVKYGNSSIVEDKVLTKAFSNSFSLKYSIPLLESHLQLVLSRKEKFVGSKCLNQALKFISASTKQSNTMEKLKPYVENILYDTIIPIMFITEKDMSTFNNDPIEYIRNQYDFTETLFQPKNQVQDLLCYLCKYSSEKKKKKKSVKPDYLHKFLSFAVKNLNDYQEMIKSGQGADFRIKEALMFAISCIIDEINSQKDLKANMEQMLQMYVLSELSNQQPFMRLRACYVYGVYGDMKFKDENHLKQVVEGIYNNMGDGQPLPVKFHAACALEKILSRNMQAQDLIKPGLNMLLKCYLQLMNELDNEELVSSFENIMTVFQDFISPFAADICQHLKQQYIRLIGQDNDEDDGESILAAVASFTSIRRILDAISEDKALLAQVEHIIYPCLLHSLTADGLDSIEEGIECIVHLVYYGYKDKPISQEMWKLYPQLLYICAGADGDMEGGFGFEFVNQICTALKNYVARDPDGMMRVGVDQEKSHLQLTYHFIVRCLAVNRNSSGFVDGVAIMGLIVAILENMQGRLDQDLAQILAFLTDELQFLTTIKTNPKNFKSMILQAISMMFAYNTEATFSLLESSGKTLLVFQTWFSHMNEFKKDFEIRRNIFGLCSIIKTNENCLPALVCQRLPDIMNQITLLTKKMHTERLEVLKDNQEHVQKGGVESDSDQSGEDEDIGDEQEFEGDSDEEWKKQQNMFAKIGPKLSSGKPLTADEMKEFGLNDDDDDDNDSDYEYNGGDMSLYDSCIDDIDELKTLKETMLQISQNNQPLYQKLMSGVPAQDQQQQFGSILEGVEKLIEDEATTRKQIEEMEKKKN